MSENTVYAADSGATAIIKAPRPASPDYWPDLANHALETGNFQNAVDMCNENLTGGKSDPLSGYLIKGKALLALGRLEDAAEEFHLALGRDPSSPLALKFLGDIRFAYGAEAVAFSYYERAFKSQSLSGGLFSDLSGAPERALRQRLSGGVAGAEGGGEINSTESSSSFKLVLPEIEIVPDESEAPSESQLTAAETEQETTAQSVDSDPKTSESESRQPSSLTLRRSPEEPVPLQVAKEPELQIPKDFPRFDLLQLAPEFQTETMADLLMRQGHARAAQGVFQTLVRRQATPQLIEKLDNAESTANKKGQ